MFQSRIKIYKWKLSWFYAAFVMENLLRRLSSAVEGARAETGPPVKNSQCLLGDA